MDQITLRNFRCFREEQTARLAPLTLLVGENSTGKTSFLAMLRALWDIAHQESIPDFKEEPYDLGSFDEIAHHRGGRGGRADTFEAGFEFTLSEGKGRRTVTDEVDRYHFEVSFGRNGTVPVPARRRLASEATWIEERLGEGEVQQIRFGTSRGAWQLPEQARRGLLLDSDSHRMTPFFLFVVGRRWRAVEDNEHGTKPTILQGSELPVDEDWALFEQLAQIPRMRGFSHSGQRPYASAPVRSKPHRTYDPARPTRDPEGDYIPMYLASVYFQHKNQWTTLKNALERFGQSAGLFDEISVKPLGKKESEPFQVQVRKSGRKVRGPHRNLIDVGYGVSQVLPVITELLRRDAPYMFLLQQPEVHLHPSAQAALGSLFCQVAGPQRQLVVETHSDHLLDRVRMDVRDGTTGLRPEDVSILFFERGDLDVRIHSLRLDKEGNVLDAPQSYRQFFMEETQRSLRL